MHACFLGGTMPIAETLNSIARKTLGPPMGDLCGGDDMRTVTRRHIHDAEAYGAHAIFNVATASRPVKCWSRCRNPLAGWDRGEVGPLGDEARCDLHAWMRRSARRALIAHGTPASRALGASPNDRMVWAVPLIPVSTSRVIIEVDFCPDVSLAAFVALGC